MTKEARAAQPVTADPVARIRAYQTGAAFLDVRWVTVTVTAVLAARIRQMAALAKGHDLSEVRVRLGPDAWGPEGIEDEASLEAEELVVAIDAFWFEAEVKHCDDHIKSEIMPIEPFLEAVRGNTFGEIEEDEGEEA